MGCDPAVAERYRNPPPVDFEVEPACWETLRLFTRLRTQWNLQAGMGGVIYLGLNYQSVEFLLKIEQTKRREEVFEHLQAMESAALEILNQKSQDNVT
jgi:Phage related hypothetical protein (DUF1799)